MERKRISGLAIASFMISICSYVIPCFLGFLGGYYRIKTFPATGYLGILFGICAIILGVSALVIISKNKAILCGYARAAIGIILGIFSSFSWVYMIIYITQASSK